MHGFKTSTTFQPPRTFVSDGYPTARHAKYTESMHLHGALMRNPQGASQPFYPVNMTSAGDDYDDDNDGFPLPPRLRCIHCAVVSSDEEQEPEDAASEEEHEQARDYAPAIFNGTVNFALGLEHPSASQGVSGATLFQLSEQDHLYPFNNDSHDNLNHFIDVTNTTQPATLNHGLLATALPHPHRPHSASEEDLNPTPSQ